MTERWNWTMEAIEYMDWWDFQRWADGAKNMYEKEEKARRDAQR